jgi:hypothetical protein
MKNFPFKISLILAIALAFMLNVHAQNANRKYLSYKQNVGEIIVTVSDGYFKIVPYNKKAIQVSFFPSNTELKNFSYAVAISPEKPDYLIKDEGNVLKKLFQKYKIKKNFTAKSRM